MRTVKDEIIEGYDFGKITKFSLNKSLEGETVVYATVMDSSEASAILRYVENSSKGIPLRESRFVEGKLLLKMDKNNFNTLTEANEEYVQSNKNNGVKPEDLYKFVKKIGENYIVEI